MTVVAEVVCWVLVGGWLLATVLAQLPGSVGMWARAIDPLGMVPAWTFFAPNPGISDPVLVGRNRLVDSSYTAWRVLWREPDQVARFLWRPDKRISKLVSDCGASLRRLEPTASSTYSVPYLLLGHLARDRMVDDAGACAWQFAVVDLAGWHGLEGLRVLFWFRSQEFEVEPREVVVVARPDDVLDGGRST